MTKFNSNYAGQPISKGLPPALVAARAQAETEPCDYPRCGAGIGEVCIDRAGDPVRHIAAHWPRMKRAAAAALLAPTSPEELDRSMPKLATPEMREAREQANREEAERYRREYLAAQQTERARSYREARAAEPAPVDAIPWPTEPPDDEEPTPEWVRGPGAKAAP